MEYLVVLKVQFKMIFRKLPFDFLAEIYFRTSFIMISIDSLSK